MKKLNIPFKPVARMILQLGDKLIRNQKIVISELVKNSYDADASIVIIDMNDIDDTEKGEIIIYDNGIGMDETMVENLFKMDVKTNRFGTENEPSTGLGLMLCKEFIERHNGKIWVESQVDKGTTFYFSFPKKQF